MMMDYTRSIARMLHEEHLATIGLLERCEAALAANRKSAPEAGDASVNALLKDLDSAVESEISSHFAFEEEHLFPRLDAGGDTGMTMILMGEHETILPLGRQVGALARTGRDGGFTDASWAEFRRLAAELVERMISHIQKEEMGLLPAVEDLLDDEADMALTSQYAQMR